MNYIVGGIVQPIKFMFILYFIWHSHGCWPVSKGVGCTHISEDCISTSVAIMYMFIYRWAFLLKRHGVGKPLCKLIMTHSLIYNAWRIVLNVIASRRVTRRRQMCRFNTLCPKQNGRPFAGDIFKLIFMNENCCISFYILLNIVPEGPRDNTSALVQVMAWRRSGDGLAPIRR